MIEPAGADVYTVAEVAIAAGVTRRAITNWCKNGQVLHYEQVGRQWLIRMPFRVFGSRRERELYLVMAAMSTPTGSTGDLHNLTPEWKPDMLFRAINGLLARRELQAIWSGPRRTYVYCLTDRMDEVPDVEAIDLDYVEPPDSKIPRPRAASRHKPKPKAKAPPPPPPPPPARMSFVEQLLSISK